MRIAFLCHRIPYPPNKGDKLRAFHQLRAMAERGHEVNLFTLADDPADLGHSQSLAQYCKSVTVCRMNPTLARLRSLLYLPTRTPLTLPYFYSADLARAFDKALRTGTYDRIFVYCSAMAQYVRNSEIPVITDLVDVDSDKWRQYADYVSLPMSWMYRREAACLAAYERLACEESAVAVVATDREAALLKQLCPLANVRVVTNGIGEADIRAEVLHPKGPTVVFTGDMAYFPNANAVEYFAGQVLPVLRNLVPGTSFLIVGRNPGRAVRALASIPGVEVTGTVPDVHVYLAQAQVSVAPFLISAGIPNKILEAMNFGLPVVATSRAVQGIAADVAAVVAQADSPEHMASTIARLLQDPDLAQRTGAEGRKVVASCYNWDRSLTELLQMIENPSVMSLSQALSA